MKSKHIAADAEAQIFTSSFWISVRRRLQRSPASPMNWELLRGTLTAIGAFERATVGRFDIASKSYRKIEVNEQCEVLERDRRHSRRRRWKPQPSCPPRLGLADGFDPRRPPDGRHGEADARSGLDRSAGNASAKEVGRTSGSR